MRDQKEDLKRGRDYFCNSSSVSRSKAQELLEQYLGAIGCDPYNPAPEKLTPQAISSWLEKFGYRQSDLNFIIGVWKDELQG